MLRRLAVALALFCSLQDCSAFAAKPAAPPSIHFLNWPAYDFAITDASGDLWVAAEKGLPIAHHQTKAGWTHFTASKDAFQNTSLFAGAGNDMFMLCWNAPTSPAEIFHFTYAGVSRFAEIPAGSGPEVLSVEKDGSIWVTGKLRHILHLTSGGAVDLDYTIPSSSILKQSDNAGPAMNPIQLLRDTQGRRWFWSKLWGFTGVHTALNGLLMWDGHEMKAYDHIAGLPREPVTSVTQRDSSHLWVCVLGHGLFSVDTETMTATPFASGDLNSFKGMSQIIEDGSAWDVFDWSKTDTDQRYGTLWRLSFPGNAANLQTPEHATWTRLVSGLQDTAVSQSDVMLKTQNGVWFSSYGSGLWWIPTHGALVHRDWRTGEPRDCVINLTRLHDNRIAAAEMLAYAQSRPKLAYLLPQNPAETSSTPRSRIEITSINDGDAIRIVSDSRRHMWGVGLTKPDSLDEWDGKRWVPHILPEAWRVDVDKYLEVDNHDLIWCFSLNGSHDSKQEAAKQPEHVVIFDPVKSIWLHYQDMTQAVEAHPVALQDDIRDGLWSKSRHTFGMIDSIFGERKPQAKIEAPKLPALFSQKHYDQPPVPDPEDGLWYVSTEGDVDRYWHGSMFNILGRNEINPFIWGANIDDIRIDAGYRYWISVSMYGRHVDLLLPVSPRRPIPIAVKRDAPDCITAIAQGAGKADILGWSLDDEQLPQWGKDRMSWSDLANGVHHISLYSVDDRGLPVRVSVSAPITVMISPSVRISRLIEKLKTGSDADREDAIRLLIPFGKAAIPALKAASQNAGLSGAWWIEAAIQKIDAVPRQ